MNFNRLLVLTSVLCFSVWSDGKVDKKKMSIEEAMAMRIYEQLKDLKTPEQLWKNISSDFSKEDQTGIEGLIKGKTWSKVAPISLEKDTLIIQTEKSGNLRFRIVDYLNYSYTLNDKPFRFYEHKRGKERLVYLARFINTLTPEKSKPEKTSSLWKGAFDLFSPQAQAETYWEEIRNSAALKAGYSINFHELMSDYAFLLGVRKTPDNLCDSDGRLTITGCSKGQYTEKFKAIAEMAKAIHSIENHYHLSWIDFNLVCESTMRVNWSNDKDKSYGQYEGDGLGQFLNFEEYPQEDNKHLYQSSLKCCKIEGCPDFVNNFLSSGKTKNEKFKIIQNGKGVDWNPRDEGTK